VSDSRTENAIGRARKAAGRLAGKTRSRDPRTGQTGTLGKADAAAEIARDKLNRG
jgi:hypothetical protein